MDKVTKDQEYLRKKKSNNNNNPPPRPRPSFQLGLFHVHHQIQATSFFWASSYLDSFDLDTMESKTHDIGGR